MKKFMLGLTLAIALAVFTTLPALAACGTMPTPGPGFGQCVATMVHACTMTGAALGQCISAMAHGLCQCPAGMMP